MLMLFTKVCLNSAYMEVTFDPGIISMDQTILGKILCKNIRES